MIWVWYALQMTPHSNSTVWISFWILFQDFSGTSTLFSTGCLWALADSASQGATGTSAGPADAALGIFFRSCLAPGRPSQCSATVLTWTGGIMHACTQAPFPAPGTCWLQVSQCRDTRPAEQARHTCHKAVQGWLRLLWTPGVGCLSHKRSGEL